MNEYSKIQPFVQKEIQDMAKKIAEQVYDERGSQFGVNSTPYHTHNGVDSPRLDQTAVEGFGTLGDVISNAIAIGQTVNTAAAVFNITTPDNIGVTTITLPIIYGEGVGAASSFLGGTAPLGSLIVFSLGGTTGELWVKVGEDTPFTVSTTGAILSGATSATLATKWTMASGTYTVTFSNTDVRSVTFTNDSTSITWSGGLGSNASSSLLLSLTVSWRGIELNLTA